MVSVCGDQKFSPGVQNLKGRGNKGSERRHRLGCTIQFFVLSFFFSGKFSSGSSLSTPIPSFPAGRRERRVGNL